jgi:hypothetical protein
VPIVLQLKALNVDITMDATLIAHQPLLMPTSPNQYELLLAKYQAQHSESPRASGEPVPVIAETLGISRATLYRTLAEKVAD